MNKPYPEYIDLSLFKFPDHIDPQVLLNLKLEKQVELEDNFWVSRKLYHHEYIFFYYTENRCDYDYTDHNPYGPSVLFDNGSMNYSIKGNLHRIDGPAILDKAPSTVYEFYLNGVYFANELDYWMKVEELKNEANNSRQSNIK